MWSFSKRKACHKTAPLSDIKAFYGVNYQLFVSYSWHCVNFKEILLSLPALKTMATVQLGLMCLKASKLNKNQKAKPRPELISDVVSG